MTNQAYWQKLQDPRWQKRRLEILQAANFTCEECGSTEKTLHVHHCYYHKGEEPWVQTDRDKHMLKCVCEDCHKDRAAMEHDLKLEFARLLSALSMDQFQNVMGSMLSITRVEHGGILVITEDEWLQSQEAK